MVIKNKYYFHKPLFLFGLLILFLVAIFTSFHYGLYRQSFEYCYSSKGYCVLPNGSSVLNEQPIGDKPPYFLEHFLELDMLFFGLLILFNHLRYNYNNKKNNGA